VLLSTKLSKRLEKKKKKKKEEEEEEEREREQSSELLFLEKAVLF
jgi:hypothetical protein